MLATIDLLHAAQILGGDLAGTVEEAEAGSRFVRGQPVAALTPGFWSDTVAGTYAQYACVREEFVAPVPEGVPLSVAGGIPLVALTAWQALEGAPSLPSQQDSSPGLGAPQQQCRALVFAAAGGVGHVAVQLAKARGMHVVGVAGPGNLDFVRDTLGAAEALDYTSQDFEARCYGGEPFDIIVDCLGNEPQRQAKLLSALKPSGHYAHIANGGTDNAGLEQMKAAAAAGKGPSVGLTMVKPDGAALAEILAMVASGALKLEVASTFDLNDVADAHQAVESRHTRGKVLLRLP